MDAIRRTLGSLFVSSGFERSLLLSTYDDYATVNETEREIQGLLGCDQKITSTAAKESLLRRLRENWTWPVVLKILLILHKLLTRPSNTQSILKEFFKDGEIFRNCQSFREGEGTDPQAQSHAKLIRSFANYLQRILNELLSSTSPKFYWDIRGSDSKKQFIEFNDMELFKIIFYYTDLLKKCLSPFFDGKKMIQIEGFAGITAGMAFDLLKDALIFNKHLCIAGVELSDRYPRLHPDDIPVAQNAYEDYQLASDQLQAFLQWIKTLPESVNISIPEIKLPSKGLPPSSGKKKKKDHFTIDDDSSSESSRRRYRRQGKEKGKADHHRRRHTKKLSSSESDDHSQSSVTSSVSSCPKQCSQKPQKKNSREVALVMAKASSPLLLVDMGRDDNTKSPEVHHSSVVALDLIATSSKLEGTLDSNNNKTNNDINSLFYSAAEKIATTTTTINQQQQQQIIETKTITSANNDFGHRSLISDIPLPKYPHPTHLMMTHDITPSASLQGGVSSIQKLTQQQQQNIKGSQQDSSIDLLGVSNENDANQFSNFKKFNREPDIEWLNECNNELQDYL